MAGPGAGDFTSSRAGFDQHQELSDARNQLGASHEILEVGIAQGYATLGRIGCEGRFDYAAIDSVTNLAARLSARAGPWQVLVTDRVLAGAEQVCVAELVGDIQPRGFSRSVRVHNVNVLVHKHASS